MKSVQKTGNVDGELDNIRKYKVCELQEIAKNKGIDIYTTCDGKKKKKQNKFYMTKYLNHKKN